MRAMTSRWLVMLILALFTLLTTTYLAHAQCTVEETDQVNCAHDLIILLDSSQSIEQEDFELLKGATVDYIEMQNVSEDCTRIGVMSYSSNTDSIYITGDLAYLQDQVPTLRYLAQRTDTHTAFDDANTMLTSSGRDHATQSVIIVTDGVSRLYTQAQTSAEQLRNKGVDIYAVGVGDNVRQSELWRFTGEVDSRVYNQNNFDTLPNIPFDLGYILTTTCIASTSFAPSPTIDAETTSFVGETVSDVFETSTVDTDETSTEVVDETSTVVVDETSTVVVDETSTEVVDETSTVVVDETSTIVVDETSTEVVDETSTEVVDETSTEVVDETSVVDEETSSIVVDESTSVIDATLSTNVDESSSIPDPDSTTTVFDPDLSTNGDEISTEVTSPSPSFSFSPTPSDIEPTETSVVPDVSTDLDDSFSTPAPESPSPSATPTPSLSDDLSSFDFSSSMAPSSSGDVSVSPSPSATDVPMSSSVLIDSGNVDSEVGFIAFGDLSVLFNNSGLEAGLCKYAAAKNGHGFIPHPLDTTKYVQCHLAEDDSVTAIVRRCLQAQFWDPRRVQCVTPEEPTEECPIGPANELCAAHYEGYHMKRNGGCGLFWECDELGVARPKACWANYAYIEEVGCWKTPSCNHGDERDECALGAEACMAHPSLSGYTYDLPILGNLTYVPRSCWGGRKFDLVTCSCTKLPELNTDCSHVTNLTLNMTSFVDAPDMNTITLDQKLRPVAIHVTYRPGPGETEREEVLLQSIPCPDSTGLLEIFHGANVLRVKISDSIGTVMDFTLPLEGISADQWRSLNVHYSPEGHLRVQLDVPGLTYTGLETGLPKSIGMCGWIAKDLSPDLTTFAPFSGEIDELVISRC